MSIETKTRYTVTTPSPKTRLSLGKWQTGGDDGPIGYNGANLHADDYLFVDIGNHALLQSHETLSVHSKKWFQHASEGLALTCAADAMFATSGLTTLVAGAGQPAQFAIDHGETITPVVYNGLELHYRTEEIQNGLFEFFLGRFSADPPPPASWLTKLLKESRKFRPYKGDRLAFMDTKKLDTRDPEPYPGGFSAAANASWKELVGGEACSSFADLDVLGKNLATPGAADKKALEYGYSRYFARHDPYLMIDPESTGGPAMLAPARKMLIQLVNGVARLRRTVDVCAKLANVLKDNAFGKSVQDCLGLLDSVNKMVNAFYRFKTWVGVFKAVREEYEKGIGAKAETAANAGKNTDHAVVRTTKAQFPTLPSGYALTIESNGGTVTTPRVGERITVLMPGGNESTTVAGSVRVEIAGESRTVQIAANTRASDVAAAILAAVPASARRGTALAAATITSTPASIAGLLHAMTAPVDAPPDADELKELLDLAGASAIVDVASEDGAIVLTSKTEGVGSYVRVHAVGADGTLLGFVGDQAGAADEDEVEGDDNPLATWNTIHGAVLDDKSLPQDVANLVRPITSRYALTVKAIEETVNTGKALAKLVNVTMPSSDGALGLLAKNGISLGTPDRIVGSASRGILLVSDGSEGAPNRAKYVPFEDWFNQVITASPLTVTEEEEKSVSLGIRAFSDSTIDLASRESIRLGALGRANGAAGKGIGSVSVLASDGAELAGRRTAVVAAREGEVQILGKHVGIGSTAMDDTRSFGVAWGDGVTQEHTDHVVVHAVKETIVVAGDFMIRVAFADDVDDDAVQSAEKAVIERQIAAVEKKLKALEGDPLIAAKRLPLDADKQALDLKIAAIAKRPSKGPIGITMGLRDAAAGHAFMKNKPAVTLTEKELRVTSHFDEAGVSTTEGAATVLLKEGTLSLTRQNGDRADSVRLPAKGGILLQDSTSRTLQLKEGKLLGQVSEFVVDGKKVQLG